MPRGHRPECGAGGAHPPPAAAGYPRLMPRKREGRLRASYRGFAPIGICSKRDLLQTGFAPKVILIRMFSSRFHWDFRPNRITQAIAAKRRAGARLLDLTQSNPTHAGLQYPPEILRAFEDERSLFYDPAPAGAPAAREAVAAYYAARGCDVAPERILLTASTSEAYAYLFKLLTNPGDRVLVPRPSYPLFEFLGNMESVEVRQYPLVYHGGWAIDMEAVAALVTERTRAVVVVNPNNPTGSYVKRAELAALQKLCAERGMALISDEVFLDYGLGGSGPASGDAGPAGTLAGVEQCLAFSMSGL